MNDNERQKRRSKKLQKQKDKREHRSRAGRSPADVARAPAQGKAWPVGDCWVSQTWDQPGTRVDAVFSRVDPGGSAVVAVFTMDRSGPGLLEARAIGGLRTEHVLGHAGRLGEASGTALIETTGGLVAALVKDAVANGTQPLPKGWDEASELLAGLEPVPLEVPFGPAPPKQERSGGLIGAISRWFGG